MGVSEDDVHLAEKLLVQIPTCSSDPNKAERVFGYASTRLARDKALRLLGTTEEEVDLENAKNLGSLGIAGRRRSYSIIGANQSAEVLKLTKSIPRARASSMVARMRRVSESGNVLRRRHTYRHIRRRSSEKLSRRNSDSEVRRLRSQNKSQNLEIEALKARVHELEMRLAVTQSN